MVQAPIFHVNGDDPEACVRVARLAFAFRQAFRKDVVIDLVCYRRRGHSEVDEPSFTQPLMYDLIDAKRSVRKLYTEALVGRGDISVQEAESALRHYREQLERAFAETRDVSTERTHEPASRPVPARDAETSVDDEVIKHIIETETTVPDGFTVHPRLAPQMNRRAQQVSEGNVDWATAETLAIGSLLMDGHPVRLAGQDSRRGTFGQRHWVLVDRQTGREYTPLVHLSEGQAPLYVYDSLLSEFAAMGFEYGYSVARLDALVCWEAQFGDFANGAQVVIDEFVASGEAKWGQRSALVLLLPHGYEGQGPDHSSARLERFLSLCAEDNIFVAVPSTPANYFHLLRRHALAGMAKPLVVFTPKSLLRLPAATSRTEEFTRGRWRAVIGEGEAAGARRVLLCAGKVFYDLAAARAKREIGDVAIVRLEELYPLPADEVCAAVGRHPEAELVWVQEEPANMGAWPYLALHLRPRLGSRELRAVARPATAAPATGSLNRHEQEQQALVQAAFAD
jgi:2-oxoglutarate dehydrogenase E1 component